MFALLCCWLILFVFVQGQQPCNPPVGKPACVCDTPSGVIDLTSISSTNGQAKFTDIPQSDGNTEFTYSYNPCTGFTEGDPGYSCSGYLHPSGTVAACQTINNGQYYSLGDPDTETIYTDSATGDTYLQYDNGEDGRITKVYLECDENQEDPVLTAEGDAEEVFYLKTKCACPNKCTDDPIPTTDNPGNGGESSGGVPPGIIGIVLILLAFTGLIAYFVIGAIILNRKYEKTGKDMIPQVQFWISLPLLVKDGFLFTFSPIVNIIRDKKGSDYEAIK